MKQSKKVFKITAGLAACLAAFVIGFASNPIKTDAGWWKTETKRPDRKPANDI